MQISKSGVIEWKFRFNALAKTSGKGSAMADKIAVKVKPLTQWSDVSNATRHGRRDDPAKHVDRSRTHLNQHWIAAKITKKDGTVQWGMNKSEEAVDIAEAFKATAEGANLKWRKNAIVGTEMLFIASPGFFGPPGAARNKKAEEWSLDCLRAAMKKYPGQIAAARLDLDETTPHFSVFLLPAYAKSYGGEKRQSTRKPKPTISHNQVFGKPEQLSALQDWAAAEMKAAGHKLERGNPKTTKGSDYLTPAEGRRRIQEAEEKAQAILRGAERAAEATLAAAKGEAAKITEKATPERFLELHKANKALEKENAELRGHLTDWVAKYQILRGRVEALVEPATWTKILEAALQLWKAHPKSDAFHANQTPDSSSEQPRMR